MAGDSTPMLLSGNHAVAWGVKLARPHVIPVYPITPQTPILEKITEFHSAGEITAEVIAPESEHSAMSACITASLTGSRVFTATSSQGLLLMHELLHYAAGARAPIVMCNVNRTVASPWAFWPDQTDSHEWKRPCSPASPAVRNQWPPAHPPQKRFQSAILCPGHS